jgi:hypothetical protein
LDCHGTLIHNIMALFRFSQLTTANNASRPRLGNTNRADGTTKLIFCQHSSSVSLDKNSRGFFLLVPFSSNRMARSPLDGICRSGTFDLHRFTHLVPSVMVLDAKHGIVLLGKT